MPGFKTVNGLLWPEEDTECAAVVFNRVVDLDEAIRHCKGFNLAVQAGGNMGVWPKALSNKFHTVMTFEPEPKNFHCLDQNCIESNIVLFQAALGAKEGFTGMAYEGSNMGACYLHGEGLIPILPLDGIGLSGCDLIQLDVEGYELEVLKGAVETISKFHPVMMIEDKGLSERYGYPKGTAEQFIVDLGYKVVARPERDVILIPI